MLPCNARVVSVYLFTGASKGLDVRLVYVYSNAMTEHLHPEPDNDLGPEQLEAMRQLQVEVERLEALPKASLTEAEYKEASDYLFGPGAYEEALALAVSGRQCAFCEGIPGNNMQQCPDCYQVHCAPCPCKCIINDHDSIARMLLMS